MANTKDRPTRSREGDLFGTFRRVKLARRRYPAAQLVACNADGQPLPQPEDTAAVDDQFRTAPHLALRPDSVGCCVLTLDRAVEPQKTAYRIYRRLRDHGWIVPVARLQDQPRGFQIWLRISDNGADGYWGTPKTGGRLVCHEPVVLYDDWMLRQSVAAKGLPTTTYARVCTLMKVVEGVSPTPVEWWVREITYKPPPASEADLELTPEYLAGQRELARRLVRQGQWVVLAHPVRKRPYPVTGGSWKDAPATSEDVETAPDFVTAIIPGRCITPNGRSLVVVDVDKGQYDVLLQTMHDDCVCPATMRSRRAGGQHLVFERGNLQCELPNEHWEAYGCSGDIRASAGYIILWDVAGWEDVFWGTGELPMYDPELVGLIEPEKVAALAKTQPQYTLSAATLQPQNTTHREHHHLRCYTLKVVESIAAADVGERHDTIMRKSRTVGGLCAGYAVPDRLQSWCLQVLVETAEASGSEAGGRTARELFEHGLEHPIVFPTP